MLYSTLLAQQQAHSDKINSKMPGQVKVKDSRLSVWADICWMPQGMADGTNHTYYHNAHQSWKNNGGSGKYTPPPPPGSGKKSKRFDTPTGHRHRDYRKSAYDTTGGTMESTTRAKAPGYTGQSSIEQPRYISDGITQDAINNTMAQGYANSDNRFQTKNLDRSGISRGQGQAFMAAQESVQGMQRAAASAAEIAASDQRQNDQMRSDYQRASEMEAQNNAMVQHSLAQSNWAKGFAEKSLNKQLEMAQTQAALQLRLALLR